MNTHTHTHTHTQKQKTKNKKQKTKNKTIGENYCKEVIDWYLGIKFLKIKKIRNT